MIYLIVGANTYTADEALKKIRQEANDCPMETIDATVLTINDLADIVRGGTLFSLKRFVVLRQLSDNKPVWDKLGDWAGDVGDDVMLVLIEEKLDKRTKTYKALVKHAAVIAADPWTEYDVGKAKQWLKTYAQQQNVQLSDEQCRDMIVRSYASDTASNKRFINQLQLAQAVAALQSCDTVTDEAIATVLPPAVADTVFDLLNAAAQKKIKRLATLRAELEHGEDGYAAFAVVMGQWAQLVAIFLAPKASAGDIGVHPYVAKKIRELTPLFTRKEIATLTRMATTMDMMAKRAAFSPWESLERFLYAIAMR